MLCGKKIIWGILNVNVMYGCCLLGADLIPQEAIPFAQLFDLHLGLDHPLGLGEGEPLAGAVRGAPRPHYLRMNERRQLKSVAEFQFSSLPFEVVGQCKMQILGRSRARSSCMECCFEFLLEPKLIPMVTKYKCQKEIEPCRLQRYSDDASVSAAPP